MSGLMWIMQDYSSYFTGSIVGQPGSLLSKYSCPSSDAAFEVSPIPELFGYQKGNTNYNRQELLRINKKNHGITAWLSYDKGFAEAAKARLIDSIAYTTDSNQYVNEMYNAIKNDGNPHGSVDFVTKWLSPDNPNLPTVYPYAQGLVIEANEAVSGYGKHVMICTDLQTGAGVQRVLYGVAHLDSIDVQAGQTISAGTKIGNIGTTGRSSTPHAHIGIHPDLIWDQNYKSIYNAGYNFYYPTTVAEILTKSIDPISIILNPELAYSIITDDSKRQQIFANASQFIPTLVGTFASNTPTTSSGPVLDAGASIISVPVFSDFRMTVNPAQVRVGQPVTVTVQAVDQTGQVIPSFSQEIDVVLSSPTALLSGSKSLNAGTGSFTVTDETPGEVIVTVNNKGSISEEQKIVFTDEPEFLQVTAPQKTTVGNTVIVAIKPIGKYGAVLNEKLLVTAKTFPALSDAQPVVLENGRGEYRFTSQQEGIYQLRFSLEDIEEIVTLTVQQLAKQNKEASQQDSSPLQSLQAEQTKKKGNEEEDTNTGSSPAAGEESIQSATEEADSPASSDSSSSPTETPSESSESEPLAPEKEEDEEAIAREEVESQPSQASQEPTEASSSSPEGSDITLLTGNDYHIHERFGEAYLVFNDRDVSTDHPVEIRFSVPSNTHAVSIFSGLNSRNFPDSGELKLSKYSPGQEIVRYFPKYVKEDVYKKIVTYDASAGEISSLIFGWSPASLHVFTDVVEEVTDPDIFAAVKALKEAGVVKGNPYGSYGIDTPINRAATATILIRSFYSDIVLDTLEVGSIPFADVVKDSWYASAIYFASLAEYEGESKSVIIKGRPDGSADPDGQVKLEEFLTMILRILDLPLETSDPWYESAIQTSIDLQLISAAEREFIDTPLPRGLVARIMVKALEIAPDLLPEVTFDGEGSEEADQPSIEDIQNADLTESSAPAPVSNLSAVFSGTEMTISWDSEFNGPFRVYRETVGGNGEISIGTTNGKLFNDLSAKAAKTYIYRVEYEENGRVSTRGEIQVLAS